MSDPEMTRLSASRIKTAKECSWKYWCKYKLKLPDLSNDGASRGTVCHLVLELLCIPKRKKYYNKIIKSQDIFAVPCVQRLVEIWARKLNVDDPENIDLIKSMTLNGLEYDYFGNKIGKVSEEFSEKKFDIIVDEEGKRYHINGFIDKLFLYKKQGVALIRDFKTSKEVFKGDEIDNNLQDLIYSLATKTLYPEYNKRQCEFIFLKFDLGNDLLGESGEGVLEMRPLSNEELEGFEYELTEWQDYLDNFDEDNAKENYAYDRGFPPSGSGFCDRLQCGFATYPGELKKDGNKKWHCAFKFSFEYWVLKDQDGNPKASAYLDDKDSLLEKMKDGYTIEKMKYNGCPRHDQSYNHEEIEDEFTL